MTDELPAAVELRALAAEFLSLADKWEVVDDVARASVYRAESATLQRRASRLDLLRWPQPGAVESEPALIELDRLRAQRDPAEVLRLAAAAHDIRPLLDEDDPRSDLAVVLDRLGLLGEQRDAVLALHVRGKDRVFHGPTVVPTCKCGASWPCETRRAMGATE